MDGCWVTNSKNVLGKTLGWTFQSMRVYTDYSLKLPVGMSVRVNVMSLRDKSCED